MFGGSRSAQDETRASNTNRLTGLERAKLERGVHGDEPQEQFRPASTPVRPASAFAAVSAAPPVPAPAPGNEAHLYAGPGIKLKGEISGCDTLRVEGIVDGNATARQLILCPGGTFLGTADIDEAEVEGNFEGTLNVRGRLFLRATGRITGTLSYGQIEIERGGEISGQVMTHGTQSGSRSRLETSTPPSSGERRPAARPMPQAIVPPPRPVQRVEAETANAPPPYQPAVLPLRAVQQQAVEPQAKPRKAMFFGRG